ncbi:hypothetical protein BK126_21440 [Paenibacillus sp. FSL H7-0326]|uniref:hypothetical protein n=1 Tax=Paenibacillus sp. FSL H7-0326 TaxID=1921144 RepID=UPI00096D07FC|nr:hypothetical protein [Paenibacillus sp. FSL H7-0326]OMC66562.1 hypothetical protein BK126_21440 [Paenibacillus sp. FSL H7-0326]
MDNEKLTSTKDFVRDLISNNIIKLDKYKDILIIGTYLPGNLTGLLVENSHLTKDVFASQIDSRFQESEGIIYQKDFRKIIRQFELIIVSEVFDNEYLKGQKQLLLLEIDRMLQDDGILLSIHLDANYSTRFPYLLAKEIYHDIDDKNYRFEVYVK